jgi:hypothetical protein
LSSYNLAHHQYEVTQSPVLTFSCIHLLTHSILTPHSSSLISHSTPLDSCSSTPPSLIHLRQSFTLLLDYSLSLPPSLLFSRLSPLKPFSPVAPPCSKPKPKTQDPAGTSTGSTSSCVVVLETASFLTQTAFDHGHNATHLVGRFQSFPPVPKHRRLLTPMQTRKV